MRILNLTPHSMVYENGGQQQVFPSDGVLRLRQINAATEPINGMTTVVTQYHEPLEIPDGIEPGDVLIVSTLVGDVWKLPDRPAGVIVLVPDTGETCRRNTDGRIISVSQFIRK